MGSWIQEKDGFCTFHARSNRPVLGLAAMQIGDFDLECGISTHHGVAVTSHGNSIFNGSTCKDCEAKHTSSEWFHK